MAMIDLPIDAQTFYIIRKVHMLSMTQMAETLGISIGYVNNIEKGREPLTDNVRRKLIGALKITPEKLAEIKTIYQSYGAQAI